MPTGNRGWTSTSASLHRGDKRHPHSQTVRWAKASIGTTEDADLVAQGKNLEEEVSTRAQG